MKNRKIKNGDYVARESHGKDILFCVEKIITLSNGKENALLKGVTYRIKADAPLEDLCIISKKEAMKIIEEYDLRILEMAKKIKIEEQKKSTKRVQNQVRTGIILHLDGDKKYSQKSLAYYKKLGLKAIVKNIPENKQPVVVYKMLEYYHPDILVITGHERIY